jgi:hypothetical protein
LGNTACNGAEGDKNVNDSDAVYAICHFSGPAPLKSSHLQLVSARTALARNVLALAGCSIDSFFNLKE